MSRGAYVFFNASTRDSDEAETIAARLGLAPSRIRAGTISDRTAPGGAVALYDWQLDSPLPESAPFEEHLAALLAVLTPRAAQVRALAERCEVGIHCQLDFKPLADYPNDLPGYPPGIELRAETLRALADLGVSLTFALFHH